MSVNREVIQSPVKQGAAESIPYPLDTSPWGGSPAPGSVSVIVYDYDDRLLDIDHDVTDIVMPVNNPTIDEDIITLSPLENLIAGKRYRVSISWTSAGNQFNAYCIVDGEE